MKEKPEGTVIKGPLTLHGRKVKLVRGGKEVMGVLLSKDSQGPSDNLAFQWTDGNGSQCVNPVTQEEIEKIKSGK